MLGEHYQMRSVAEQNSFDLAWDMLMDNKFADLLCTICHTQQELSRLRELVINGVLVRRALSCFPSVCLIIAALD